MSTIPLETRGIWVSYIAQIPLSSRGVIHLIPLKSRGILPSKCAFPLRKTESVKISCFEMGAPALAYVAVLAAGLVPMVAFLLVLRMAKEPVPRRKQGRPVIGNPELPNDVEAQVRNHPASHLPTSLFITFSRCQTPTARGRRG